MPSTLNQQTQEITTTKTYELERRVQTLEESCKELRREYLALWRIVTGMQRRLRRRPDPQ